MDNKVKFAIEDIERFKDEDDSWLDNFLNILINSGESFTNFGAKYTLIS